MLHSLTKWIMFHVVNKFIILLNLKPHVYVPGFEGSDQVHATVSSGVCRCRNVHVFCQSNLNLSWFFILSKMTVLIFWLWIWYASIPFQCKFKSVIVLPTRLRWFPPPLRFKFHMEPSGDSLNVPLYQETRFTVIS